MVVRKPSQRQIRPGRVYQTVTALMEHRVKPNMVFQPPVWYKVVESIPPAEMVTRPFPAQHKAPNPWARKPRKLFQPQVLEYKEDALRTKFYKDHPWELARPRMVIETDGKDALRVDWSKGLRQPGMALSGESVVQRQMWLMENDPTLTEDQAYDKVRKDFYLLRQEEEIERRVAKEEARMVGSYFGMSDNQVGMLLEDQQFERWKRWATKEIQKIQGEQGGGIGAAPEGTDDKSAIDVDALAAELESPEEVAAPPS